MPSPPVRHHAFDLPLLGRMAAARTERGVCLLLRADAEEAGRYLARRFPGAPRVDDPTAFAEVERELREYLEGRRTRFSFPLDPVGTEFQQAVWRALLEIPFGSTTSYGAVAAEIGRPTAVRAVGAAVGANPICVVIPCHRVIGASGSLTGFAYGLDLKRALLSLEKSEAGETPSLCKRTGGNLDKPRLPGL